MRSWTPLLALAGWSLLAAPAVAADPVFPLRSSADGRTLVDAAGRPFLYHADTAWALTKRLTPAEIDEYLQRRKEQGWNAIHVHAVSKEVGPAANREGHEPFTPLDDILKPNEPYWRNVDAIVAAAAKRNLLVAMSALWLRWGGKDREGWRAQLTDANARAYGTFLGRRFARHRNLLWILGGDANPWERTKATMAMAAALRAAAPHQLITFHGRPENASANFFHNQPWHAIDTSYTYDETHKLASSEWNRPAPVRPCVLMESGYEGESNDKRGGDPARMRRQAWSSLLAGCLGGHAYGHKDVWRFSDGWRQALDAPGARHLAHFRAVITAHAWWRLVPDQHHQVVTEGRGAFGDPGYVTAAQASDRSFALAYLPRGGAVTVDGARFADGARASWIDPTDGARTPAGTLRGQPASFTAPARNAAGDPDFVLSVETANRE